MPKLGPNNSGSGIFAWYYDLTLIHGRYFYYVVIHTAEELFYLLYPGLFLGGLLKGDMCHGLGVILYNGQPGANCSKVEDSHIGWKIPILPFRTGIRWFTVWNTKLVKPVEAEITTGSTLILELWLSKWHTCQPSKIGYVTGLIPDII